MCCTVFLLNVVLLNTQPIHVHTVKVKERSNQTFKTTISILLPSQLNPSHAKRKVSFMVERSTTSESSPSFLRSAPR